ncbi:MAG: TolC family protein [Terracidiphilus sp.]
MVVPSLARFLRGAILALLATAASWDVLAQSAPPSAEKVWHAKSEKGLAQTAPARPNAAYAIDPAKQYTLAELIDQAEAHNPDTRVAWEAAKSRAASLGIARAALFPTMAAVALAETARTAALIGEFFHRQTLGVFEPVLHVEYLVFDIGGRSGAIDEAKANLLTSDLAFNDTHRKIIFAVASAYYRLLNAVGQREAAEVSLTNARTVEEDAQSRLQNGLATKPDQLEATAARAQADFDLQAAVGAEDIVHGDLATVLGLPPDTTIQVQPIADLALPSALADSVDHAMDRAFAQRPDLLEQLARLRAAQASLRQARSTYFPSLSFSGDGGLARAYGQQDLLPGSYAQGEAWSVGLELRWTLFDGTRRDHEIARAEADKKATQAEIDSLRDQIGNEVWAAYTNMKTALRQQQSAAALLAASEQSYESAHQSYGYGVRSLLDVVSAQKALAQARSEDVFARTQLLLQAANLSFRTGDLIELQPTKAVP